MIVSAKRILELNNRYKFINNLSGREKEPEGVGIDVRVGEIYSIKGSGFLGIEERNTPEATRIASFPIDKSYTLRPNEYVLVKTIESINIPAKKIIIDEQLRPGFITVDVKPRTTLFRCGVSLEATKTDPGYFGELTFGLNNVGGCDFELELGARIANIVFEYVVGEVNSYKGQWKGGRVFKVEKEKQT